MPTRASHIPTRFAKALRAGMWATLLTQLVLATLVTPLLAVHSDAAHVHEGQPQEHVHALHDLFASGPITIASREASIAPHATSATHLRDGRLGARDAALDAFAARAPPALAANIH